MKKNEILSLKNPSIEKCICEYEDSFSVNYSVDGRRINARTFNTIAKDLVLVSKTINYQSIPIDKVPTLKDGDIFIQSYRLKK